jgi:hypothetical protein
MTTTELHIYTNVVLLSDLMIDYMDQIKDTPKYRNRIKLNCTELSADLEKVLITDLPKLYEQDELITVNCMREMKDLIENISSCAPDDLLAIGQLIKSYKENKEVFLDKHQITLRELNG